MKKNGQPDANTIFIALYIFFFFFIRTYTIFTFYGKFAKSRSLRNDANAQVSSVQYIMLLYFKRNETRVWDVRVERVEGMTVLLSIFVLKVLR